MAGIAGTWEAASLRGKLLEEGWGAAMGYPAIIPDENGEPVQGFVFSSEVLSEHWERLDEFEGPGYQRIMVKVAAESGQIVDAFVYALNQHQ